MPKNKPVTAATGPAIISALCGTCLDSTEAHHSPSACFRGCGARFDRGAPLALVMMEISRDGPAVTPTYEIDFRGTWSLDMRASVREALGL